MEKVTSLLYAAISSCDQNRIDTIAAHQAPVDTHPLQGLLLAPTQIHVYPPQSQGETKINPETHKRTKIRLVENDPAKQREVVHGLEGQMGTLSEQVIIGNKQLEQALKALEETRQLVKAKAESHVLRILAKKRESKQALWEEIAESEAMLKQELVAKETKMKEDWEREFAAQDAKLKEEMRMIMMILASNGQPLQAQATVSTILGGMALDAMLNPTSGIETGSEQMGMMLEAVNIGNIGNETAPHAAHEAAKGVRDVDFKMPYAHGGTTAEGAKDKGKGKSLAANKEGEEGDDESDAQVHIPMRNTSLATLQGPCH
ncbi:hypothetical protein FA15DRAFT_659579 [Coprinopsis marcescibilis]|uniref:Uncharacterized protein n=1 Tax=Coprinopsis marcescibilis TaxID=230819 RepID=A0A5C3KJ12_COPMA|nr:hypothetical protein FA15DRAFT_659579 [Coprinopsis marcescibilis]